MTIFLLRHGETDYNARKKYLGRTDIPLSRRGREALIQADFTPETVYTSPLRRTAETAAILFPGAKQIAVSAFQEIDFGLFEGKSYRELADFPAYQEWVDGGCLGSIPEGESIVRFSARTCAAFEALVDQTLAAKAEILAIVAHGGTQMAVMERFALPRRNYFSWIGPLGGGYILDAAHWREERVLLLADTVRYTRGEP